MIDALICRIVVEGNLAPSTGDALGGFVVTAQDEHTVLEGTVADQAQLAALMERMFGLGISVVSFTTESAPSSSLL